MSILGHRMRESRARKDLTQTDLAERVNTSQRQISKYERGVNEPSSSVIVILARELDVTADYLLGLTDIPDRPIRDTRELSAIEVDIIRAMRNGDLETALKLYLSESHSALAG